MVVALFFLPQNLRATLVVSILIFGKRSPKRNYWGLKKPDTMMPTNLNRRKETNLFTQIYSFAYFFCLQRQVPMFHHKKEKTKKTSIYVEKTQNILPPNVNRQQQNI